MGSVSSRPRRRLAAACAGTALALTIGAAPGVAAPKARPDFDVFFLIEASESMGKHEHLSVLVDSISRRLAQRTTLRHGYGVYRPWGITESCGPFPTYYRLSPVRANGGSTPDIEFRGSESEDGEAPHTVALYEALGAGRSVTSQCPEPAGFTPHARKLVVLLTDSRAESGGPSIPRTAARYRAAGVAVAAVHLVDLSRWPFAATVDLREITTTTGATARGAVDCTGDGQVDSTAARHWCACTTTDCAPTSPASPTRWSRASADRSPTSRGRP